MTKTDIWVQSMRIGRLFGCHQMPARSFSIGSYQFPLCARCTGILAGHLVSLPLWRRLPGIKTGLMLLLPMALDGSTQLLSLQTSTNGRRLITGILGGVGYMALLRCFLRALRRK